MDTRPCTVRMVGKYISKADDEELQAESKGSWLNVLHWTENISTHEANSCQLHIV